MAQNIRRLCLLAVAIGCLAVATNSVAEDGKSLFARQCASCHTIGNGDEGGPDLKGVAAKRESGWLVRVISEPDKLTADNDPIQQGLVKKYGYEMPNLGVSRDDARMIVAYLKTTGGGAAAQAKPEKEIAKETGKGLGNVAVELTPAQSAPVENVQAKLPELVATPELISAGRAYFTGGKKFAQGGAPCGACHGFAYPDLQSGNLAADLSSIYERLGEQGMRGVLKSLKFPIMKKVYADKPLSDDEIVALIAFAKDGAARKAQASGGSFPGAGVILLIAAIVILTVYKRRIG